MPHIEVTQDETGKSGQFAGTNSPRISRRRSATTQVNILLMSIVLCGTLFQLFAMPSLLRAFGLRAALLLVPITLLQPLHWGLIHEAIHSRLLQKRRTDEFCGRLLSVIHWLPFDATRFCHLVHHRYSRHAYDRPDVYDGRGSYVLAWLRYRGRLLGGVYWSLLASPMIAFIPIALGERVMGNAVPIREDGDAEVRRLLMSLVRNVSKRRRTRLEFTLALTLYGVSAWAYGAWWPLLLASMSLRGIWHSLADNVAHHDVPLEAPERARNFVLPRPFGLLAMNQHLHLTHHRYPKALWSALPRITGAAGEQPTRSYFRAALSQLSPAYPRVR
jgi:fatty acid desaturase